MSEQLAPVPIADGTVRRLFGDPEFRVARRGYHPDDVVAFLDDLGSRMVNLVGRLQGAEKENEAARTELAQHRRLAEQAESSKALFGRTLALAEETANAAVADARQRAARIEEEAQQDCRRMIDETRLRVERMMDAARADVQRVYADERTEIAEAEARLRSESDQLETLRLAVAAETMALEEVRNELRRRIRRVATDLLGVAESPDCLGTPVTRGIPEVVAEQSATAPDQEAAVPAGDEPVPVEARTAGAIAGPDPTDPTEAPEVDDPDTAIDLSEPAGERGSEAESEGEDKARSDAGDVDDAFERFMSDEIEEEPSRSWILT